MTSMILISWICITYTWRFRFLLMRPWNGLFWPGKIAVFCLPFSAIPFLSLAHWVQYLNLGNLEHMFLGNLENPSKASKIGLEFHFVLRAGTCCISYLVLSMGILSSRALGPLLQTYLFLYSSKTSFHHLSCSRYSSCKSTFYSSLGSLFLHLTWVPRFWIKSLLILAGHKSRPSGNEE